MLTDRETITQPKGRKGEPSKKELLDDLPAEMFEAGDAAE